MSNFFNLFPGTLKLSDTCKFFFWWWLGTWLGDKCAHHIGNGWEFGETLGIRVVPTTVSNSILAWALQETKSWSSFLKISTFFLHSLPLFPFPLYFAVLNLWCGHCQRGAPPPTHPGAPLCQSPLPKFLNSNAQSKWERGRECRKVWWFFLPT